MAGVDVGEASVLWGEVWGGVTLYGDGYSQAPILTIPSQQLILPGTGPRGLPLRFCLSKAPGYLVWPWIKLPAQEPRDAHTRKTTAQAVQRAQPLCLALP